MPRRPRIPAQAARAVLIESGHRCSVCGTPCPLERAHIIPWHKSKNHDPENLVCLCANCHQRSEVENWGSKTLQRYKQEPWVMRRFSSAGPEPPNSSRIEIVINAEYENFDDHKAEMLRYALAGLLRIPPKSVRVLSREEGTVRLEVELPSESADRLLSLYESSSPDLKNHLALFEIMRIKRATLGHRRLSMAHAESVISWSVAYGGGESTVVQGEPSTPLPLPQSVIRSGQRIVSSYHIPAEDAEDIIQSSLLDLLYRYDEVKDPRAYLLRSIRKHCILYWRRHRRGSAEDVEGDT